MGNITETSVFEKLAKQQEEEMENDEMNLITSQRDLINIIENRGYSYGLRHLNIYADDFKDLSTWQEVLQCLGIEENYGVTLAIVGVKKESEEEVVVINDDGQIYNPTNIRGEE